VSRLDDIVDKFEELLEKGDPDRLWAHYRVASHEVSVAEEALQEAQERRTAIKDRALAADLAPVLRKEFRRNRNVLSVLNLLRDVGTDHPRLVLALLPELYDCCLGVSKGNIWGREILRTLSRTTDFHDELAPLVRKTLSDEDEVEDVFSMNGLGMLLDDIGDTALLDEWRRAVSASPDVDVRELAEDCPLQNEASEKASAHKTSEETPEQE
jgi:hypothetical protein